MTTWFMAMLTLFALMSLASMPCTQQTSAITPSLVQLEALNQNGKTMPTNVTTDSPLDLNDGSATDGNRGAAAVTGVMVVWGGGLPSIYVSRSLFCFPTPPALILQANRSAVFIFTGCFGDGDAQG